MILDFLRKLWPFNKPVEPSVRDTIEELIEESEEGESSLDPEEKTLLTNILNLRNLTAEDIMVPRADIHAVPIDIKYHELKNKMASIHNTRLPVYRGTLDDVIGYIHVKDILEYTGAPETFKCEKILKDVLFVAPSMRLLDLLLQMKVTRVSLALVVDEYGGVDGLITTWDIIDEFLGDLNTFENLNAPPEFTRLSDNSYIADARLPVDILMKEFALPLQDGELDEIETLGGLVFALAGRVPARSEVIKHPSGLTFEVLEADARRVRKIRIFTSHDSGNHDAPHP